jgi:hypothetical protein
MSRRPPIPPRWVVQAILKVRSLLGSLRQAVTPPPFVITENLYGILTNKLLGLAAELRIADHLHSGPKTAEELAPLVEANPDALYRMLRAMVALRLLGQHRDGRFKNNAVSEVLREDHPDSVRSFALFLASDWTWEIWNEALHSIRTGQGATEKVFGQPFFEMLASHPERNRVFATAMSGASKLNAPIIPKKYDFSHAKKICDVAGGTGTNLAEILVQNPDLRGVLFEIPEVLREAPEVLSSYGVADRVELVAGSMFESIPEGCDLYMLQSIVHDWDDERCLEILGSIRKAMPSGARVLVLEMTVPEDRSDHFAKLLDMAMLFFAGGARERTRTEFETLYTRAGFRVSRIIPLPTLLEITELILDSR